MKFPTDIHTHEFPLVSGEAIVNCYPEQFVPRTGGWYSVGIHPWLVQSYDATVWALLERLASHPQVLAIGEAGLDKLTTAPLSLQLTVFQKQAYLASSVNKPLLIHLVKAVDELLQVKKKISPAQPWIIHGFRGKAALANTLLNHGFYLSFGEKYQEEALRAVPLNRLFLETDESNVPIYELYEEASRVRGVAVSELCVAIQENINNVFFR